MITTIIPTFERPLMLRRAIESSLAQGISGHVIHVHDNASSDETQRMVSEFASRDSRVKYFRNRTNIGAARNITNGISAVKTRYYSLLSDDDFLLPGFYKAAIDAFRRQPRTAIVCAKTLAVDLTKKTVEYRNLDWDAGFFEPSLALSRKMYSSHFVTTSVVFSAEVREMLGPFEPTGSDTLYMSMAAAIFPFCVLDLYGAAVVFHNQAYSSIEDGIAKETLPTLLRCMSETMERVILSGLPDEKKIHILLQVVASYEDIMNTKRLRGQFFGQTEPSLGYLQCLPSLTSNRGIFLKLHQSVPKPLQRIVSTLYTIIHRIRGRLAQTKRKQGTVRITRDTMELLSRFEPDVSLLNFHKPPRLKG